MLPAFDAGVGNIVALATGAMMLGLAVLLLALHFSNRLHQSFALLLTLNGIYIASVGWDVAVGTAVSNFRVYLVLAIPFAAAAFALRYSATHGLYRRAWLRNLAPWVFLGGAIVVEALYLQDHTRFWTAYSTGPLHLFFSLSAVVFAIVAVLFVRDYRAAPNGRRRRSFLLAALGFSLEPLYVAVFHVLGPAGDYIWGNHHDTGHFDDKYLLWTDIIQIVPLAFLLIAAVLLVRAGRAKEGASRRNEVRGFLAVWAAVGIISIVDALQIRFVGGLDGALTHRLLISVVLAVGPGLIAYSLVKHQLFDADVRLRWAIKNSTLAGVFIATFLVVTQYIQNATTDVLGVVGGAVAAGLLLFALTPLQRVAERIATKAMPPSRPISAMSNDERTHIYREQLEIAWSDGTLSRIERMRFEKLRERLGITAHDAVAIENRVLSGGADKTTPLRRRRERTLA